MRSPSVLALAAMAALMPLESKATETCDSDCPEEAPFVGAPAGVEAPLNARMLVLADFPVPILQDAEHAAVAVRTEPASGRYQWLIPDVDLEPTTTYRVVAQGGELLGTFTTGTRRDDEAPANVSVTMQADHLCEDIEWVETYAQSANDPAFIAQLEWTTDVGTITSYRSGLGGSPMDLCRWRVNGEPFNATVTLFDLAGNASAPQSITVTPTGYDSGCSYANASIRSSRSGQQLGLALLVFGMLCARRRRRG